MRVRYALLLILWVIASSCGNHATEKNMTKWLDTPAPGDVRITDNFWRPKIDLNRETTIPYVFRQCEETGRIDNFAIAGGLKKGKHTGERYNNSDVFKVIEGACYSPVSYTHLTLPTNREV